MGSNPILVDKKQGAIRICTNFCDLNRACPKDNFPTPFIDQILDECTGSEVFSFIEQILDECAGNEVFSFMDSFSLDQTRGPT